MSVTLLSSLSKIELFFMKKKMRHGFSRRKILVFAEKNFGAQTRREEKQLDTQCTLLCLVFPPGALPGGHTHRSSGIPCGA